MTLRQKSSEPGRRVLDLAQQRRKRMVLAAWDQQQKEIDLAAREKREKVERSARQAF
jgi:hypothetical protein